MSAALLANTAALAQETYYWPAPTTPAEPGVRTYIPIGTGLVLRTRTEVNTKQMKPGDRVHLEVAESLTYRGQIVIPAGAPAVAEVVRSERNGHFGKKGEIEIRLLHAQTPHCPVRLNGGVSSKGKAATAWSVPGAVLVAWPLIFVHGTSGYIRQGTAFTAYLAEPLTFTAFPSAAQTAATDVQPRASRPLPTRFDPSVFGENGPGEASR